MSTLTNIPSRIAQEAALSHQAEAKARRALSSAQSHVRANPLLSLLIAVAAGMVVRHLVRR